MFDCVDVAQTISFNSLLVPIHREVVVATIERVIEPRIDYQNAIVEQWHEANLYRYHCVVHHL